MKAFRSPSNTMTANMLRLTVELKEIRLVTMAILIVGHGATMMVKIKSLMLKRKLLN